MFFERIRKPYWIIPLCLVFLLTGCSSTAAAKGSELSLQTEVAVSAQENVTEQTTAPMNPVIVAAPNAASAAADGRVHVKNVDEFLAAINHNTTIYLEPGIYNFALASGAGSLNGQFYRWEQTADGPELVILDVVGLTIEGAGKEMVTICTTPHYANVLSFDRTVNLILRGITIGHTQGTGESSGGVLAFNNVTSVNVEGCHLYGSGTLGVWANNSNHLYVVGTEIHDCSSGAAWFSGCTDVRIDACKIHDNGSNNEIMAFSGSSVSVDGVPIAAY